MQVDNKSLTELQEQRGRLYTEARNTIDEAEVKGLNDERKAELNERADKIFADLDSLDKRIEREEKLASIEARAQEAEERARKAKRPNGDGEARGAEENEGVSYRSAFHQYLRAQGQLGSMGEEARSVLQSGYQKVDGKELRAQTTTGSAGGFTIPEQMMPELVRSMLAFGPMYDPGITREIVTSGGNPMPFPTVNDTTVTAGAHTEGATLTDDGGKDVTFAEKQLDAFAFDTEWLRVSKELADDSEFGMEALLASLLGERLGRIANLQLTTGSGSSAPNGIVTASAAGKVAASTSAITYDEILDFEHSIDPAYRGGPNVGYMLHDSTLLAIRKLKDGDGNYLWQMGNVQAGIPNTFNGRSYYINQDMPELSDGVNSRVMLFGDMSKYYVRKVGAPLIGAIQDKDFWPGFGIAGYIRFDGELADTAAVKHLALAAA